MMGFLSRLFAKRDAAIVDARPTDAAALAAVHAASFRHDWSESEFERLLADRSVIAQVARGGGGRGAIAGFIVSRIAADEAEILTVAVRPAERGRRLASELVRRHLSRLAALGIARVFLEVEEGNRPALRLYARAGFDEVGQRKGYYQRPAGAAAALILRRDLA
jgi:ribosomal-protein-alanine N-acetyltransferase